MISNYPAGLNFNRLFLKLHRFICNQLPVLPDHSPEPIFPRPMFPGNNIVPLPYLIISLITAQSIRQGATPNCPPYATCPCWTFIVHCHMALLTAKILIEIPYPHGQFGTQVPNNYLITPRSLCSYNNVLINFGYTKIYV